MPGALPDGEPVPADGTLPESARHGLGRGPFGIYVHVPFCTTRCGYCDFNTYTAAELGGGARLARGVAGQLPDLAVAEIGFARKVLGARRPAGQHGVLRRRDADPAAAGRASAASCGPSTPSSAWLPGPR